MKHLLIIILMSALFIACQKKDSTAPDAAKVTMNIASPVPAQTFRSGDTVHISANVSYPSELHGYEVKITDTVSGYILYDDAQHVHDDHFDISDKWVNMGTQAATLKLELTAEVDHAGTVASKVIYFQYHP